VLIKLIFYLTYAGSGNATTVETVIVENLTQGKSLTMNGTNDLNLKVVITGIEMVSGNVTNNIVLYPNP